MDVGCAVGDAQVEAVLGDELGVHNQVFVLGSNGGLEVLEGCQLKLTAENLSVEFDGFSGVTGEGEIGG